MKKETLISVLITIIICSAVFTLCGIILLPAEIKSSPTPAGDTVSDIPYSSEAENSGLLLLFESGGGAFAYLNFEDGRLQLYVYENSPEYYANLEGFDINYTIRMSNSFLGRLCDRLGGIAILEGGAQRRYSAVGLVEKLEEIKDNSERIEIISSFFEKISKIGLSSDDVLFIIEETENDLVYPVCYHWITPLKNIAENCVFG